jgi:hypothetical protein
VGFLTDEVFFMDKPQNPRPRLGSKYLENTLVSENTKVVVFEGVWMQ